MFETGDLKTLDVKALQGIYKDARGACVATGKYANNKAFDAHAANMIRSAPVGRVSRARVFAAYALDIVAILNSKQVGTTAGVCGQKPLYSPDVAIAREILKKWGG